MSEYKSKMAGVQRKLLEILEGIPDPSERIRVLREVEEVFEREEEERSAALAPNRWLGYPANRAGDNQNG